MSPVVNMLFEGESVTKNIDNDWISPARLNAMRALYLAGHNPEDPLASPVYAHLYGLPRLYIQAGTHELLLSDIASFVDKARWAGVPVRFELWEGMFHCWQAFARQGTRRRTGNKPCRCIYPGCFSPVNLMRVPFLSGTIGFHNGMRGQLSGICPHCSL